MTPIIESGTVEYTGRAFHQDAMEAMRGDILRGLIEMITNSDDAYLACEGSASGKITIEVEHRRNQSWSVTARDRATGMQDMVTKVTRLGGRTSGFEAGEARRGNLGRGAKDLAAFGDVTFASIHDGAYSELLLRADGTWELRERRGATHEDRASLGIRRGNGTVVTIQVEPGVRCPQHANLRRRLSTHYQLRDILSDPARHAELVNLNDGARDLLAYEYPSLPEVFDRELSIPGYDGVTAHITIYRHPTRHDDGPDDPGRPNGILVKGQRAIYENTLFRFEGDIHAGWFSGKLICPHIDQLARQYDDRLGAGGQPDPKNPAPIISRRRDGLNPTHPFVQALREAVEEPLGRLIAEEAERARRDAGNIESDETRSALDRLARELSRIIGEELRDIEAEELPDAGEGEAPLLAIVPEQAIAYMGEDRTLTVAARADDVAEGDIVQVSTDPTGVVEVLTTTVPLKPHTRREDILVGQIRIRPLIEDESTIITAELGDRKADALIEVRSERLIVEDEVEAPDTLKFEQASYRVGWQREKSLMLLAPSELVEADGTRVHASSSDPGVVVRTPSVQLSEDAEHGFYRGSVRVQARTLNATSVVTARLGDVAATALVAVTRREEGLNYRVRLVDEDYGINRAIIETEPDGDGHEIRVIKIAGRHPALRPYLQEGFVGQNTPICRGLLSEIVADATARVVVSELYRLRRGTEVFDVDRFYREHYKRLTKFLPRFQRILVGDPSVAIQAERLAPLALLETSS
jgi:hypothetical protein